MNGKLEQLRRLDAELRKSEQVRKVADDAVRVASEHESVQRFLQGGSEARRRGWGYSWASDFTPWYLSRKPRHAGMTSEAAFFMDPTQCPPVLCFSEKERDVICRHHEAKGVAQGALVNWSAIAEQRALLLRESPELVSVA